MGGETWLAGLLGEFLQGLRDARLMGKPLTRSCQCRSIRCEEGSGNLTRRKFLLATWREDKGGSFATPCKGFATRHSDALRSSASHEKPAQRFSCPPKGRSRRKAALLVDDVLTTGSTLDECARMLLAAGAEAIYALTVARG